MATTIAVDQDPYDIAATHGWEDSEGLASGIKAKGELMGWKLVLAPCCWSHIAAQLNALRRVTPRGGYERISRLAEAVWGLGAG